jgi:hypothetical protein
MSWLTIAMKDLSNEGVGTPPPQKKKNKIKKKRQTHTQNKSIVLILKDK